jgi:NAD(P)-dependent dehydrogenase (short-subunit alcohol dehydrogenase family)
MKTQRVVVVTGAGRGIPAAVVRRFAAEGASVAAVDLLVDRAKRVSDEVNELGGGRVIPIECDVRQGASVARMVDAVHEQLGLVDVLVNAAGSYFQYKLPHETTEEEWDSVVDSNLKGVFLCCKAVLPDMMSMKGGRIINFASNAARSVATALGVEYTAAKTGVLGVTRHIAKEYAKYNILVNTIAPGPTNVDRVRETTSDEFYAAIPKMIPLGRYAEADEIAAVVQFLASDAASFVTGATIDANGGIIMV